VQPRQPFIGKYVPGWAKQLGIIEPTDMEIGQRGQALDLPMSAIPRVVFPDYKRK
jgi:hypothetical protein